jgi:hypothetical protein
VVSSRELAYNEAQLPKVQQAALEQIARVRQLEREGAARAVLAGLSLHRVKASLKHGHFLPWLKANLDGKGYSQVNYYMRLALVFVEKAHVSKPALLALPSDQLSLQVDAEGEAHEFFGKLDKFVGSASLNELLEKHGIKSLPKLGGAQSAEDKAEQDSSPISDPESIRLQSMDEISSAWERSRRLLIKENILQHFAGHPEKVQAIVQGYRELADEIEKAAKPLMSEKI